MILRLLLAFALAVGLSSAQSKRGGGGGQGMGGDMGMMRPQRQSRLDLISEKLKLSSDQKEAVGKIFDNAQEKTTPLNEQIRNGRSKITSMIMSGTTSGDEWDNVNKAFTAVLAQEETIEAEAYQKLYAALDEKQKPKAAPVFEELMNGMFAGRDWRRGSGGMGGR